VYSPISKPTLKIPVEIIAFTKLRDSDKSSTVAAAAKNHHKKMVTQEN